MGRVIIIARAAGAVNERIPHSQDMELYPLVHPVTLFL